MNIPKERIEGPGSVSKEAASRKPVEVKRDIGGAAAESGRAPVSGVVPLGLGRFGCGTANAAFDYLRAAMEAGGPRGVAEPACARRRAEVTATHVNELIDEIREKSEDAIAPMTGLLAEAA